MRTSISTVRADGIAIRGRDLVEELIGHVSFTRLVFLLIGGREPERSEEAMTDACLVALADHGLTLSAVVARATSTTAPESLQGAVAAGLLGVGDAVAGSMEGCGESLRDIREECESGVDRETAAESYVARAVQAGARIGGFGHGLHTGGDPRADRLLELAREWGVDGEYVAILGAVADALRRQRGRELSINVTGAIAAVLMDVGFSWRVLRGFALIARCAGLVAHVQEESGAPIVGELRRRLSDASRDG
ncbi:MAG: citryl-CoA lyase [Sciscionella sp.]